MAKIPHVDHIIEWNKRRGGSSAGSDIISRISNLETEWLKLERKEEFADFIPIKLVTILEVFVRETLKNTIDNNYLYLERAEPLLKSVKVDFLMLKSMHGNLMTIGDIVAHVVSVNKIDDIIATYEVIFPGYRESLASVQEKWREDDEAGIEMPPIIDNIEIVIASVGRLFQIRHILVHEIPAVAPYSFTEIDVFISSVLQFINATDWFITVKTQGFVPRTQLGMNISAENDLDSAEKDLKVILDKLKDVDTVDVDLLRVSQEKWQEYANAESNLYASVVTGGSMYPMLWAYSKATLTRDRAGALSLWLERKEGEF